ncbi:unnamed protein product [Peniophora sp. CBMAI 1063]|nr:unnamed protein product [Peniophora sp. CBMAI 1063]
MFESPCRASREHKLVQARASELSPVRVRVPPVSRQTGIRGARRVFTLDSTSIADRLCSRGPLYLIPLAFRIHLYCGFAMGRLPQGHKPSKITGGFRQHDVQGDNNLKKIQKALSGSIWRHKSAVLKSLPLKTALFDVGQPLESQLLQFKLKDEFAGAKDLFQAVARAQDELERSSLTRADKASLQTIRLLGLSHDSHQDVPLYSPSDILKLSQTDLSSSGDFRGTHDSLYRLIILDWVFNTVLTIPPSKRSVSPSLWPTPVSGPTAVLYSELVNNWPQKLQHTVNAVLQISEGRKAYEQAYGAVVEEEEESMEEGSELERSEGMQAIGTRALAPGLAGAVEQFARFDALTDVGPSITNMILAALALAYLLKVESNSQTKSLRDFADHLLCHEQHSSAFKKYFQNVSQNHNRKALALQPLLLSVFISPILLLLGCRVFNSTEPWRLMHILAIFQRRVEGPSCNIKCIEDLISRTIIRIAVNEADAYKSTISMLVHLTPLLKELVPGDSKYFEGPCIDPEPVSQTLGHISPEIDDPSASGSTPKQTEIATRTEEEMLCDHINRAAQQTFGLSSDEEDEDIASAPGADTPSGLTDKTTSSNTHSGPPLEQLDTDPVEPSPAPESATVQPGGRPKRTVATTSRVTQPPPCGPPRKPYKRTRTARTPDVLPSDGEEDVDDDVSSSDESDVLLLDVIRPEPAISRNGIRQVWKGEGPRDVYSDEHAPKMANGLQLTGKSRRKSRPFVLVNGCTASGGIRTFEVKLPHHGPEQHEYRRLWSDIGASMSAQVAAGPIQEDINHGCPYFIKVFSMQEWIHAFDLLHGQPVFEAMRDRKAIWIQGSEMDNFFQEKWEWTLRCLERIVPAGQHIRVQDPEQEDSDMTASLHTCTLKEFMDAADSGRILNMLDAPASSGIENVRSWREFSSNHHSQAARERHLRMNSDNPNVEPENVSDRALYQEIATSSSWSIISLEGANSLQHTDAAGVWTTIMVPHGGKLWAMRSAMRTDSRHDVRHLGFARDFDMYDADVASNWATVYLETGHSL